MRVRANTVRTENIITVPFKHNRVYRNSDNDIWMSSDAVWTGIFTHDLKKAYVRDMSTSELDYQQLVSFKRHEKV